MKDVKKLGRIKLQYIKPSGCLERHATGKEVK